MSRQAGEREVVGVGVDFNVPSTVQGQLHPFRFPAPFLGWLGGWGGIVNRFLEYRSPLDEICHSQTPNRCSYSSWGECVFVCVGGGGGGERLS